jgi:hypothetical protein
MYVERKWNLDPRVATIIRPRRLRWNRKSRSYRWGRWGRHNEYSTPYNITGMPVSWWWKDPLLRECLVSPGTEPCILSVDRVKARWLEEQRMASKAYPSSHHRA